MQGRLLFSRFFAIIVVMNPIRHLFLLSLCCLLLVPAAPALGQEAEDGTISIEFEAADPAPAGDSAAAANITADEPVRVPREWTMLLYAFAAVVIILSFASKGRSKPPDS